MKKTLLLIFAAFLCVATLQAQIRTVGGDGNSTANIRMRVNSGGNFQVKYNGSNQIFESTTDDPDSGTSGVPGTLQGRAEHC